MYALWRGAHELNPLVGLLVEKGGLATILLAKAGIVVFAAYLMVRAARYGLKRVRFTRNWVIVVALFSLIVTALNMVTWRL